MRGLHDEVQLQPTAKGAAQERGLQGHVFRLEAQRSGHGAMRTLLELSGSNQQAFAILEAGGEVHRLQRRMRLHGRDVLRLDGLRRTLHGLRHIAHRFANGQHLAAVGRGTRAGQYHVLVQRGTRTLVPLHGQSLAGFLSLPVTVGDHRHAVIDLNHIDHTGHALGAAGVKTLDLAANHRTLLDAGVHHARQLDVDTELGRAIDFGRGVQTLGALADDFEIFRILQHHFLRHRQLGRGFGQLAIAGLLAACADHHAVLGLERAAIHFPLVSGRTDQHLSHLGTTDAQFFPSVAHRS